MKVREVIRGDFSAVMGLYRQLHPEDPILEDGNDMTAFEAILASDWLKIFVLEYESQVRSTCYLNIIPNITRSARPYAVIENVVTDKAHRNLGFGKVIIQHTLNYAWGVGCYKAMLQTGSKQQSTHSFYRSCGFSGSDKTAYLARPTATQA